MNSKLIIENTIKNTVKRALNFAGGQSSKAAFATVGGQYRDSLSIKEALEPADT